MHRDIKLENFLVKGRVVKLCDYGISIPGMWSSGPSGTPGYMAPEVSSGQPYNLKVDIFSLACVHHKILTGRSLIPDTLNQIPRWHETTKLMSRSLLFCSLILFFYIFFAGLLNCQCWWPTCTQPRGFQLGKLSWDIGNSFKNVNTKYKLIYGINIDVC